MDNKNDMQFAMDLFYYAASSFCRASGVSLGRNPELQVLINSDRILVTWRKPGLDKKYELIASQSLTKKS